MLGKWMDNEWKEMHQEHWINRPCNRFIAEVRNQTNSCVTANKTGNRRRRKNQRTQQFVQAKSTH